MNTIYIYLLGYACMMLAFVAYKAATGQYKAQKGVCWYTATKVGLLSWAGIIMGAALLLTWCIGMADEWIYGKLNSKK